MCGCLSGQSRAVCNQPFSNSRLELGLWYWYSARRRLELGLWSLTSLAQRGWLPLVSGGLAADPFSAPTRPPKAPPRGWLPRNLFFVIAEPPGGGGNWHWHSELRRSSSDFGTGTQSCGDWTSDFDTGYSALRRLELGLCYRYSSLTSHESRVSRVMSHESRVMSHESRVSRDTSVTSHES